MRTRVAVLATLITLLFTAVHAQSPREDQASKLLSESKWADAEAAYAQIVAEQPRSAAAWINLGEAQLQQNKFDTAEKSFALALELKFRPVVNRMNLARVAAARGDRENVIARLRELVANGQGSRARPMLGYAEFNAYRSDAEFTRIAKEEMAPCRGQ